MAAAELLNCAVADDPELELELSLALRHSRAQWPDLPQLLHFPSRMGVLSLRVFPPFSAVGLISTLPTLQSKGLVEKVRYNGFKRSGLVIA